MSKTRPEVEQVYPRAHDRGHASQGVEPTRMFGDGRQKWLLKLEGAATLDYATLNYATLKLRKLNYAN
jgi:hypothetical protein